MEVLRALPAVRRSLTLSRALCGLASLCLLLVTGCIPPAYISRPDGAQRFGQIRKIALLPPRVSVYELGAGGVVEKIDEWSETGTQNVLKAFQT